MAHGLKPRSLINITYKSFFKRRPGSYTAATDGITAPPLRTGEEGPRQLKVRQVFEWGIVYVLSATPTPDIYMVGSAGFEPTPYLPKR